MFFRNMNVSAENGSGIGFFLSRGLFFLLLLFAGALGFVLAALLRGFYPHDGIQRSSTPAFSNTSGVASASISVASASVAATLSPAREEAASVTRQIQSLVQLGRHYEANAAIREALKKFPDDPEILIVAAAFFQAVNNPLAAEKMLLKAQAADRNRQGVIHGLVKTYIQAGLWSLAENIAKGSLQKFPDDPILVLALADCARLLANLPEAILRYREYLCLVPNASADSYFYLAQCLRLSGSENEMTFYHYRKALQIQASHVPTLNDFSLLLASSGNFVEAVKLIPALLEHSREAAFALDTAGLVNLLAKQFDTAEPLLLKAQASEPGNPNIAAHLSILFSQKGDKVKAEEWSRQAEACCRGDQVLLRGVIDEYKTYRP